MSTTRFIGGRLAGLGVRSGPPEDASAWREAPPPRAPTPPRASSLRWLGLLLALAVGATTTTLVGLLPSLRATHGRPLLHAEIVTASALVALLVSLLAVGRYRRRPAARDLFLAVSLALLGASNLLFAAIPAATDRAPGSLASWLPACGRLLAAGLLAAAALAPARSVHRPARAARLLACGTLAALGLLAIVLSIVDPSAPEDVGTAGSIALKGISAALMALAAAGFAIRGRRRLDGFWLSLTWGTTLLAFAWVNYLLVASLYVDWFYAGDVLALAAYALLAIGAAGEIRAYQRDRARLAAVEERGRVARELHDGVAQELVHVLAQARRLHARQPGSETERLLSAAERALDESRSAISTLRAPLDEPLSAALERTAGELGRRLDIDVRVRTEPTVEVAPPVREAVMRIVGEALANAARHGGARTAAVEVSAGEPPRVTVRDDGRGFDADPRRIPAGAYGLLAMRERAESFGGALTVRSAVGAGTEVEVALP
jgi:signal transduction histidine kinase